MFNSVSHANAAYVKVVDGDIGPIEDLLFDDRNWVIRYLVVDASTWLPGREVLISPYSIRQPVQREGAIDVALTRRLVRTSPYLDLEGPVTRQQENDFERHYRYPAYWNGDDLWALGSKPYPSVAPLPSVDRDTPPQYPADMQLRSAEEVLGYELLTAENSIGPVRDFVFDDESWQIRYLVVDTDSWWPGGRSVLIALPWVDRIDWAARQIHVALTREQVKCSPAYQDVASIHRGYEVLLHANYQRPGYWA